MFEAFHETNYPKKIFINIKLKTEKLPFLFEACRWWFRLWWWGEWSTESRPRRSGRCWPRGWWSARSWSDRKVGFGLNNFCRRRELLQNICFMFKTFPNSWCRLVNQLPEALALWDLRFRPLLGLKRLSQDFEAYRPLDLTHET